MRDPSSSPGRLLCVVQVHKTLTCNSLSASLHPGVLMGIGRFYRGRGG